MLLVDTGTTILYNVDVTPERNKDEFVVFVVVVVVLEAFSGDQSIQRAGREAAVGRRASRQLHDIVVGIAVVVRVPIVAFGPVLLLHWLPVRGAVPAEDGDALRPATLLCPVQSSLSVPTPLVNVDIAMV